MESNWGIFLNFFAWHGTSFWKKDVPTPFLCEIDVGLEDGAVVIMALDTVGNIGILVVTLIGMLRQVLVKKPPVTKWKD